MVDRSDGLPIVPALAWDFGGEPRDESDQGVPSTLPLALDLQRLEIPRPGVYEVQLRVQERLLGTLNFAATLSPSQ